MNLDTLHDILGLTVVGAPTLLVVLLGGSSLLDRPLSERMIARLIHGLVLIGLSTSLVMLALMLINGSRHIGIDLGHWVVIPHYHFSIEFVFDRLSVPFVILSYVLCGTVGQFAIKYMHREAGFSRFFVFYSLFLMGMVIASLANTIETLFAGWELVGLSSALLVAFYQDRPGPVRNGLRVWSVYRVSDAALLVAAVLLHHLTGEGDFDKLMGLGPWPEGHVTLSQGQALVVGLLLLVAAAGKSALVPFSGWLPRAMEGPTPSSAVFYGALSVHLGAFLLLRVGPLLEASIWLSIAVVIVGLTTAAFGALAVRVQTDIKSALSFASMSQVGLIVAEIGFGLRYFALIHIIGHACLRTLQFVRAPTLLLDYRNMENAIGARLSEDPSRSWWFRFVPERTQQWFFRVAIERGYLDAFLFEFIVAPVLSVFRWCDAAEQRWASFIAGEPPKTSRTSSPQSAPFDELTL